MRIEREISRTRHHRHLSLHDRDEDIPNRYKKRAVRHYFKKFHIYHVYDAERAITFLLNVIYFGIYFSQPSRQIAFKQKEARTLSSNKILYSVHMKENTIIRTCPRDLSHCSLALPDFSIHLHSWQVTFHWQLCIWK